VSRMKRRGSAARSLPGATPVITSVPCPFGIAAWRRFPCIGSDNNASKNLPEIGHFFNAMAIPRLRGRWGGAMGDDPVIWARKRSTLLSFANLNGTRALAALPAGW